MTPPRRPQEGADDGGQGEAVLGIRLPGAVLVAIVSAFTGGGAAIIAAPQPQAIPPRVEQAMDNIDRQLTHNLGRIEAQVLKLTEQVTDSQVRAGECCARVGALERQRGM